jgi:hypothetical protein
LDHRGALDRFIVIFIALAGANAGPALAEGPPQTGKAPSPAYREVSFTDFELDKRQMRPGEQLAMHGFYQVSGRLEVLSESLFPTSLAVPVLSDGAPRDTRATLLKCRSLPAGCNVTLLGHVTVCQMSWMGRPVSDEICLAVDSIRDSRPTY